MSIVQALDAMAEWLHSEVCLKVKLKPRSIDNQTTKYEYKLVNPEVFAMYTPTTKNKPPEVEATTPSICLQLIDGTDSPNASDRAMRVRLSFSAWNPGLHGPDILTPTQGAHRKYLKPGDEGTFRETSEGWRDVWNFVDTALRVIENAEAIGGYGIDKKEGIKFGPFTWQNDIPDFNPFWFAWVELTVREQIIRNRPEIDQYL